jgi:glycerophosphoryl diester phosphodiesterase
MDTFICHRGLHGKGGVCPENSLAAFEAAVSRGFAIELDVQLLADGEVVVFHDADAERMTGQKVALAQCEARHVRTMYLLGSDHTVPLLDDVVDLVGGEVPLLIELKGFGNMGRLGEAILNRLNAYPGPFALQSFNPKALLWLKINAPHVPRGQISGSLHDVSLAWHRKVLVRRLLTNVITKPHFISYEVEHITNTKRVQAVRKHMPVIGWTVRSTDQYERLKHTCDNIIFEGFDPFLVHN